MTILVLGATGFIGQQVLLTLSQAGHSITGLGRDTRQARARFPTATWIARDLRTLRQASYWHPLLGDVTAVISRRSGTRSTASAESRSM